MADIWKNTEQSKEEKYIIACLVTVAQNIRN